MNNGNIISDDFIELFQKLHTKYIQEKRLKVSDEYLEEYKQNEITSESFVIQKFYLWMINQ
jgi:hypothetical protein